ncbi:dynamin family protein [Bdellovibrionota bacterium FG-1]
MTTRAKPAVIDLKGRYFFQQLGSIQSATFGKVYVHEDTPREGILFVTNSHFGYSVAPDILGLQGHASHFQELPCVLEIEVTQASIRIVFTNKREIKFIPERSDDQEEDWPQFVKIALSLRANVVRADIVDDYRAAIKTSMDAKEKFKQLVSLTKRDNLSSIIPYEAACYARDAGDFENAIQYFRLAESRGFADLAQLHCSFALAYQQSGNFVQAERYASTSLEHADLATAHMIVGQCLRQQQRISEAKEHFLDAIKIVPTNANAAYHLALIAFDEENKTELASRIESLKSITGTNSIQYRTAKAYLEKLNGDQKAELFAWLEVLEIQPENSEALRLAALLNCDFDNGEGALPLAKKLLALDEQNLLYQYVYCRALSTAKRHAELLQFTPRSSSDMNDDDTGLCLEVVMLRAHALCDTKRFDEAKNEVDAARVLLRRLHATDNREAIKTHALILDAFDGQILVETGHGTDAIPFLERASRLQKTDATKKYHAEIADLLAKVRQIGQSRDEPTVNASNAGPSLTGNRSELRRVVQNLSYTLRLDARLKEQYDGSQQLLADFDAPLMIAVLGEFNAGKSTFVNALVGKEILPMDILPATATINIIRYGEPSARILWQDGSTEQIPPEQIYSYLSAKNNIGAKLLQKIRCVEIFQPLDSLKNFTVVDTPGLNAPIAEHRQTTERFLERADTIIWLSNATQPAKKTELSEIVRLNSASKKVIAVLNHWDRTKQSDRVTLLEQTKLRLQETTVGVFPVSAKAALLARAKGDQSASNDSGISHVEQFLVENIGPIRMELKHEALRYRAIALVRKALLVKQHAMQKRDDRDQRLQDVMALIDKEFRQLIEEVIPVLSAQIKKESLISASWLGSEIANMREKSKTIQQSDFEYLEKKLKSGLISPINVCRESLNKRIHQAIGSIKEGFEKFFRIEREEEGKIVLQIIDAITPIHCLTYDPFDTYLDGITSGFFINPRECLNTFLEPQESATTESISRVIKLYYAVNWQKEAICLVDMMKKQLEQICANIAEIEQGRFALEIDSFFSPLEGIQEQLISTKDSQLKTPAARAA